MQSDVIMQTLHSRTSQMSATIETAAFQESNVQPNAQSQDSLPFPTLSHNRQSVHYHHSIQPNYTLDPQSIPYSPSKTEYRPIHKQCHHLHSQLSTSMALVYYQ